MVQNKKSIFNIHSLRQKMPNLQIFFQKSYYCLFCAFMIAAIHNHVALAEIEIIRILPLGDSITAGDEHHSSYRRPLWLMLQDFEENFDFIGSRKKNGYADYPLIHHDYDPDHEGHSGWKTADLLNGPDGWDEERGNLGIWLTTFTPDIALIHIGTNDIFECVPIVETFDSFAEIIMLLRDKNPDVVILIALLLPIGDKDQLGFDDNLCPGGKRYRDMVVRFNEEIVTFADMKNTSRSPIYTVDQYVKIIPEKHLHDGIHPNKDGEIIMAKAWLKSIQQALEDTNLRH